MTRRFCRSGWRWLAILSVATSSARSDCDDDRYRRWARFRMLGVLARRHHRDCPSPGHSTRQAWWNLWPVSPISLTVERNVLASHAMSAKVQAGALGKRFNSSSDGANSCAWPGTSTKSMSRPAASQTPTILLPNPPLERPRAWLSPLVLRLNRRLTSLVCSVALRPPSDVPAQSCHRCRQKPVLARPRQPRAP
jgi:hypothetical protein